MLNDSGELAKILSGIRCPHVWIHFYQNYLHESWTLNNSCPMCNSNQDLIVYTDTH